MNIIVLGDIILDINYFSKIHRNAPEADNIPIHNIYEKTFFLGGASNVANNLKNLDTNVELITIIGHDYYGEKTKSILEQNKIKNKLFIDPSRKTTQKHRIFHNNILNTRYDIEDNHEITTELSNNILEYIKCKKNIDAIVLSDYNKGVCSDYLIKSVIYHANNNNIFTFVDPKIKNYMKYKNSFCFKPNLHESEMISGLKNINQIIDFMKENINCQHLIITCGKDGIIVDNVNNIIQHESNINVVDVTGSGDVVLSILVYIYLLKKDMYIAAKVANYIAGIGVSKIGNYCINKKEVDSYFEKYSTIDKIIFDYEVDKIINLSHKKNIVFTNGCFDILHSAHIELLQFSKKQGDILVVGLNSDTSIKRLKGELRPINLQEERMHILSLFDFIDYIIIFENDTPLQILQNLKPTIIVKGADYIIENIIGKEYCEKVVLFNYIKNKSSTSVINKIKNSK